MIFLKVNMTRRIIPLRFCKSKVPLVTFGLADNDELYYAIIDTGSEISIINDSLRSKIKTKEIDAETNLVGVNGGTGYRNLTQGVCNLVFNDLNEESVSAVVGGMVSDLKAISSHFKNKNDEYIPIAIIIGGDFLKHYNAKINYRNKTLTIDVEEELT